MLETAEELGNLQQLLDRSMAGAGEHLRGIITGERRLSAAELAGRLQGMRLLTVATVTADGRPLAGPVDGYFLHGPFWFSSGRTSVRMRHLAARPAASATSRPAPSCARPCWTGTSPGRDRSSRAGWTRWTRWRRGSSPRRCSPLR